MVLGNFIGTNAGGANLGNAVGVMIDNNAGFIVVSGTAPDEANTIGHNTTAGIDITGSGDGNVVQGNFIGTDAALAALGIAAV